MDAMSTTARRFRRDAAPVMPQPPGAVLASLAKQRGPKFATQAKATAAAQKHLTPLRNKGRGR
jgi:hypothetical protein